MTGIKFHDGTDLNADAVATNIDRNPEPAVLVAPLAPIETVVIRRRPHVTVTMNEPWPASPSYLNSQLGYMGSPTWIAAVEAGTAQPTEPVGTGPFQFESYESGDNGWLTATRFEDYWRGDGPNSVTGEGSPTSTASRSGSSPTARPAARPCSPGDIDLIQTANGVRSRISRARTASWSTLLDSPYEIETSYLLINNSAEVGGRPTRSPTSASGVPSPWRPTTRCCRRPGPAGCSPRQRSVPPGVIGNLEDTGYPTYDPERDRAARGGRGRDRPARGDRLQDHQRPLQPHHR